MEAGLSADEMHECTLRLILPPDYSPLTLTIGLDCTVLDLKAAAEEMEPTLSVARQRVVFGGRQLHDSEALRNVFKKRIEEGVLSVHVTLRRAAGSTPSTPTSTRSTPATPGSTSPFVMSRTPRADTPSEQLTRSASAPASVGPSGRSLSATAASQEEPALSPVERKPAAEEEVAAASAADAKPPVDPADAMRRFLLNQAYWQAATQYGMIMTHAAQLGLEVPFGSELFLSPSTPGMHGSQAAGAAYQPQAAAAGAAPPQEAEPGAGEAAEGAAQNAPMNPEEAELNAQIAEFENGGGMEQHLKLAFKLIFLVVLLHQDAGTERLIMLCSVALLIFLLQSGVLQAALQRMNFLPQNTGQPAAPLQHREGVIGELQLFFYGFFASMFPNWQPPEFVPVGELAQNDEGQTVGTAEEAGGAALAPEDAAQPHDDAPTDAPVAAEAGSGNERVQDAAASDTGNAAQPAEFGETNGATSQSEDVYSETTGDDAEEGADEGDGGDHEYAV